MSALLDALAKPHPCRCQCHEQLSVPERVRGITALMRFDDAVRGWGYEPSYEPSAHHAFLEAKMSAKENYRVVPIRDETCIYGRLVGFAVHELIHAMFGDIGEPNWGVPWGVPYGVPRELPREKERDYLEPYNFAEACAWIGPKRVAAAFFDIEWPIYTARDVGTYGFTGGNSFVEVPPGFRAVSHVSMDHAPHTYYARARKLEQKASDYMTADVIEGWRARFRAAETAGSEMRRAPWPDPESLARLEPTLPGRNDMCLCGSGKKYKRCCG